MKEKIGSFSEKSLEQKGEDFFNELKKSIEEGDLGIEDIYDVIEKYFRNYFVLKQEEMVIVKSVLAKIIEYFQNNNNERIKEVIRIVVKPALNNLK